MNPILINPKIDSEASTAEQLAQMKSYLRQFKEQVELILMNIDQDNMSEKFEEEVYEGFSKRLKDSKTISEITQTAGMIRLSVKDLENSMASITLTVDGIVSEVYDSHGNSRITQTANAIDAEVTRATDAEGTLSGRISVLPATVTISASASDKTASFQLSATKEGGGSIVMSSDSITFSGLVSFTNLSTNDGSTSIDGGNIRTGNIDAQRIQVGAVQIINNTVTAAYVNALGITTSSIEVTDSYSNTIFSADANARACHIGGFEVDATRIMTNENDVSASYPGLMIRSGVNGSTKALAIGYTSYSSYNTAKFYVNGNGEMHATGATISGNISLNSASVSSLLTQFSDGYGVEITSGTVTATAGGYSAVLSGGGISIETPVGDIELSANYGVKAFEANITTIYAGDEVITPQLGETYANKKYIEWKQYGSLSNSDYVLVGS